MKEQEKCEVPEIACKIYEILSNFIFNIETYWAVSEYVKSLKADDLSRPLWVIFSNNCLMMATTEWCKVFGSPHNNKTHYTLCIDPLEGIKEISDNMKAFRDKYISHYDFYNEPIPFMDKAVSVVDKFDQAMLNKYGSDNQESTDAYIIRTRKEIRTRLKAIIGSDK